MAYATELGPDDVRKARENACVTSTSIRGLIGVPPFVVGEVEVRSLPSGARFVMPDGTIRVKK
jgi:hypothetical protein